jgi:poly(3-hydroxybutyrate) depolymerase
MNHQKFLVFTFILFLSVGGFTQASGFGKAATDSFKVAGVMRYYSVHAPGGLNSPPLVFNIHGYNIDGPLMESITQMDKVADREKFIIVYPSAINKSWNMTTGGDDLTFIVAIIDTIDKKYHVDRNRVYVTGFSQGGFISFLLGCKYSDVFAAIAPVSGLLPSGTCTLKRPVPLFFKFGTKDVATVDKFMASLDSWLKLDNCPSTPKVTRPYPSTNPKSAVTRLVYGPCDGGIEVVVDSVRYGTHDWVLNSDTNVNTSEETWAFLKDYTLKGGTAVSRQSSSAARDPVTVSFRSGIVRLQGAGEECRVRVVDTKGRVVAEAIPAQNQFAFSGQPGGVYLVMMSGKGGPGGLRMVVP